MINMKAFLGYARGRITQRLKGMQGGWSAMGELMLGVRVAAVPVASAVIGLLMFYAVEQVHDLFLETAGSGGGEPTLWPSLGGVWLWTLFYVCVLVGWVLTVYLSSRWIITRYNGLADSTHEDSLVAVVDWVRRALPLALALVCLLAVLIGQFQAAMTSPEVVWEPDKVRAALKEQSALLEKKLGEASSASGLTAVYLQLGLAVFLFALPFALLAVRRWIGTFSWRWSRIAGWVLFWCLALLWLASVFALLSLFSDGQFVATRLQDAERYLPDTDPGYLILALYAVTVLPPLALWLLSRWIAAIGSRILKGCVQALFWVCAIGAFAGYVLLGGMIYVARAHLYETLRDPLVPMHLAVLPLVTLLLAWATWRLIQWFDRTRPVLDQPNRPFIVILLVSTLMILVFAGSDPLDATRYLNRAPLLAMALGIWVPPLTLVALWSFRLRTPLILAALAMLAGIGLLVGDTYAVRHVALRERPQPSGTGAFSLDASLALWAQANGNCTLPKPTAAERAIAPAGGTPCPKPLIVLAAGGASRASFLVSATLGKLMDTFGGREFSNQIFAISGVSGGSLAAAMFQAALTDSMTSPRGDVPSSRPGALRPPCADPKATSSSAAKPSESWADCMMLLQAGDFLSPTMVSLLFSDLLNFGFWPDRAATLERAWERRYFHATGNRTLEQTLRSLRPKVLDKGQWMPHLLLNGTSVSTGRRIVASDLEMWVSRTGAPCVRNADRWYPSHCYLLFKDAYDLHDLLWYEPDDKPNDDTFDTSQLNPTRDIRLSTGATLSARFPVLSPHGAIFSAKGRLIDRVVDGGYFENNGALTAIDVAEALQQKGLQPVVLLITNEPSKRTLGCDVEEAEKPPLPRPSRVISFSLLHSPLRALLGTRQGRGTLASVSICRLVRYEDTDDFVHVRVEPQPGKVVSMSWWLSNTVQAYLRREALAIAPGARKRPTNDAAFRKIANLIIRWTPVPDEPQSAVANPVATLSGHAGGVTAVAFSPDGRTALTGSFDNMARLWDTASGMPIVDLPRHPSSVVAVAFSPDGRMALTGSADKSARLWEWRAGTGRPAATLSGHTGAVNAVAFSPDGRRVLTGSEDNTARLWDAATGTQILSLSGHTGAVNAVAFSPDGRLILTGSDDTRVRFWNAGSGMQMRVLAGHTGGVSSVAFSPDGSLVLTGSGDRTARLWDTASGTPIGAPLSGHTASVLSVAFSPDGKLALTGSFDNTARLWEVATGRLVSTISGHTDAVWAVAMSQDGRLALTGSGDKTARLWDATQGSKPTDRQR